MSESNSILDGIPTLVDDWLELSCRGSRPLYRHKSAALELSDRATIVSAEGFLRAAYRQIDQNWRTAVSQDRYSRSKQNWRFEKRTDISPDNTSPEVTTERAIVRAADHHWVNQVPTSSGLVGPSSDTTRNVDLVRRDDKQHYQLIELKIGSDNPLYAAIEILLYGVLLAWSRNNSDALNYEESIQPLLSARSIQMSTLAPRDYYSGMDLSALRAAIDEGLASCLDLFGMPCSFQFTQFDSRFILNAPDQDLLNSALQRETIWQTA